LERVRDSLTEMNERLVQAERRADQERSALRDQMERAERRAEDADRMRDKLARELRAAQEELRAHHNAQMGDSTERNYGPNRLPVAKGPSALALLAEQVTSPLIYALVASAAVAFRLRRGRGRRGRAGRGGLEYSGPTYERTASDQRFPIPTTLLGG
jgi:Cation transporter/ATPase, N-terminus